MIDLKRQALEDFRDLIQTFGHMPIDQVDARVISRVSKAVTDRLETGQWCRARCRYVWDELLAFSKSAPFPDSIRASIARQTPVGSVYLMRAGDAAYKIGFTAGDAQDRLLTLATAHYEQLEVLLWANGSRSDERLLHELSAPWRLRREWFSRQAALVYVAAFWLPMWSIDRAWACSSDPHEVFRGLAEDLCEITFPKLEPDDLLSLCRTCIRVLEAA